MLGLAALDHALPKLSDVLPGHVVEHRGDGFRPRGGYGLMPCHLSGLFCGCGACGATHGDQSMCECEGGVEGLEGVRVGVVLVGEVAG